MPYWNCERCGARLYSASRTLRRQTCPTCQGRLMVEGDWERPRRFEHASRGAVDVPGDAGVEGRADVRERR
jgi:DNA-directed RNA polymerase subunit RPC12/RpoP